MSRLLTSLAVIRRAEVYRFEMRSDIDQTADTLVRFSGISRFDFVESTPQLGT